MATDDPALVSHAPDCSELWAIRSPAGCSKWPAFSAAQSRRLLHPPALSLPRQPIRPGTRLFPNKAAANYRLPRGGWDDPNCARPTRAFSCRALREQGDRPSYPRSLFQHPASAMEGAPRSRAEGRRSRRQFSSAGRSRRIPGPEDHEGRQDFRTPARSGRGARHAFQIC